MRSRLILGFCFMLSCGVFSQTDSDKKEIRSSVWNLVKLDLKEYMSPLTSSALHFNDKVEIKPLKEKVEKRGMPIYDTQVLDPKMKTELPEDLPKGYLQIIKPADSK